MNKTFKGQSQKSLSERQLEGIVLLSPARIGATVFNTGVPVFEVIARAQREYEQYNRQPINYVAPAKEPTGDPWIREMYAITTKYHIATGKKIVIGDLLEAFFVQSMKDVDEDDRPAFEARLRERLA